MRILEKYDEKHMDQVLFVDFYGDEHNKHNQMFMEKTLK